MTHANWKEGMGRIQKVTSPKAHWRKPEHYASTYYAAALVYSDEDEGIEEGFVTDLIGDVLADVVMERGDDMADVYVVVEDAITISNEEGQNARVFIVQALHPVET